MIEHIGDGLPIWLGICWTFSMRLWLSGQDVALDGCLFELCSWFLWFFLLPCIALPFFARGMFKGIFLLRFHPSDIHSFAFSLSSYNFSSHESL